MGEFSSPALSLSLKSWRVKAPAWSLTQVGLMRTHYRAQPAFNFCYNKNLTSSELFAGISSEEVQPLSMSLEAEMMLEQLKDHHLQEMRDLQNQLQNKVSLINVSLNFTVGFIHLIPWGTTVEMIMGASSCQTLEVVSLTFFFFKTYLYIDPSIHYLLTVAEY